MKEKIVEREIGDKRLIVRLGEDLWDKEEEAMTYLASQIANYPDLVAKLPYRIKI